MEMTMDKNRLLGFAILVLIPLIGAFYAIWLFFFNNGQIIVEGVPPFSLSINGQDYTCLEMQCSYSFRAREYSYTISKEGYTDESGSVSIQRGKIVLVSYDAVFEAKPLTGVDYPKISLPVGYSKYDDKLLDVSLFHMIQDGYLLQKMPKQINNIEFSPSGNGAILFEDEAVSYYKTDTFEQSPIEILKDAYSVAWNNVEGAIYSIAYDDASKKDALLRVDLSTGVAEKNVYFLRNVDKYSLSVSKDEKYLALTDTTSDLHILYAINMEDKSRTNVFEGYAIQKGQWSDDGNYYIFSGKADKESAPVLWLMDAQNKKVEMLNFNAFPRLITSAPGGKFYFVSTEKYSLSGSTRPYFSDFKDDETLTVDDLVEQSLISLHVFDLQDKQTYLVLELSNVIPGVPEKIEANDSGAIIRMLVGEQYFDVKVAE
ncbi:hypothetical protein C0416_02150 [bacterium]|nr:hypothetical protein [bacterium]